MLETEVAWAAGFFDGEGSIGNTTEKRLRLPRLVVQVVQTDRQVLDRFLAVVEHGTIRGPYQHKKQPNQQPYFQYALKDYRKILLVVAKLLPYLSPIKAAQARSAIRIYEEARA